MRLEPPRPRDRALVQRLIRDAFARSGASELTLAQAFDAIRRCGTQLAGVGADKVSKLRREQVREELFAMKDVRVREANTPRERFCLRA